MRWLALALVSMLLPGCVSEDPPMEADAPDCGSQTWHPYESRCLGDESAPDNEVCSVWLGEGAQRDDSLFCEATSDGQAHARISFDGSGSVTVYVRDPANEIYAQQTYGPGQHTLPVDSDDAGRWRLVADLRDATGPITVELWG